MLYFKKSELAETYHISEKTVTNWIREAKAGKLPLDLHQENGKAWITNTTKNITLIEELVEGRKKYRNTRGIKTISPKPEFYQLYTPEQIFDITSSLDICREIPHKYAYFDGGAEHWATYAERLASEEVSNFLTSAIEQLRTNQDYLDHLTRRYQHLNIVDIGPGNVLPVKALLQHFLEQSKLERYVAVDISPAMIKIAERNFRKWFGSTVEFDAHEADIDHDRLTSVLSEYALGKNANSTANILFALGGTLANLRSPDGAFKIIHDSMNRNDLFIYNLKLDSDIARRYFDFATDSSVPALNIKSKMILDLLNIDESFYDVEVGYDPVLRQRYTRIRLKVELTIQFNFEKGERILEFNKNESISVWRYWHQDVQEVLGQLYRNDFDVLQSSLTEDKEYLLTISRVKSER